MTPERYGMLCDAADRILKKNNPCKIKPGESCERIIEYGVYFRNKHGDLCCGGCKHHSPLGCKSKSLSCKTWLCGHAWDKYPKVAMKLHKLHHIAISKYSFRSNIRETKEEYFNK